MSAANPNILFIMSDQYRYDYLGALGADHVRTPNLDRLIREGTAFTQCCSNSPICAPARIGLATGMQPARLGARDNAAFLPHRIPTYYQRLRDHGYRVGCVGKLDLAKPDSYNGRYGDRPLNYMWGFTHPEECEGKMHAGSGNPPLGPYTNWLKDRGELEIFCEDYRKRRKLGQAGKAAWDSVLPTEAFEDSYIGQRAVEWLEWVPQDFPWHYFVSFVGPHNPFDPPTEFAEHFRDADMPAPISFNPEDKPQWARKRSKNSEKSDEVLQSQRQYCAAIEAIDVKIGEMLDVLEKRGMRENTYIIFSSDHGEMLGDQGMYTKDTFYESSMRVPLVVSGPRLPAGVCDDALVELIDLAPTITELAGAGVEENIDAISLVPLLKGEVQSVHGEVVSYLTRGHCARTARYKAVQNYNDTGELYDLETDPQERNNIAGENPELFKELAARPVQRLIDGGCLR